jgi:hypothetical protein
MTLQKTPSGWSHEANRHRPGASEAGTRPEDAPGAAGAAMAPPQAILYAFARCQGPDLPRDLVVATHENDHVSRPFPAHVVRWRRFVP